MNKEVQHYIDAVPEERKPLFNNIRNEPYTGREWDDDVST